MNTLAEWNGQMFRAHLDEYGTAIVADQHASVDSEEIDLNRFDDDGGAGHG